MPFGSCQKLGRSFPYWFLVVQRLSSRLTWHDFAYVTMVQKVRSGSVMLPLLPKVTYSNGLGPYIPVTPDPESQPRDAALHTAFHCNHTKLKAMRRVDSASIPMRRS